MFGKQRRKIELLDARVLELQYKVEELEEQVNLLIKEMYSSQFKEFISAFNKLGECEYVIVNSKYRKTFCGTKIGFFLDREEVEFSWGDIYSPVIKALKGAYSK